jgi:quinol-cytochrome oxidoreductase complex cytochrome b subunit
LLPQILRSIFPEPLSPPPASRHRRFLLRNLALHFRPTTVPRETLRFSLTWGLGGMAATLAFLQIGSGLLLKFAYEPTPVAAYASIQALMVDLPFGGLVRNLHYWCAHLIVAVILLHLLRVFFTGAFHPPRQFNWVVGLGLIATVLSANFTGYLLPYDQLAYWAVTVSTGMLEYVPLIGGYLQELVRGGREIGPQTLQTFYALHTAVIPLLLFGLMAFHFWRVRKARGLVVPRSPEESMKEKPDPAPTVPDLLVREITVALALTAAVLLLAAFVDAPLGDPANPGLSPNPTRAPWYFAGLQELLLHLHPVFAVWVIPSLVLLGLLAMPYLNYETDTGGIWFASRPGRKMALLAAVTGIIATPLLILTDEWRSTAGLQWKGIPPVIGNGLIPTVVLLIALGGFYGVLKKRFGATTNEICQSLFTLMLTAYGILTIAGVWFRGAGMTLAVPW